VIYLVGRSDIAKHYAWERSIPSDEYRHICRINQLRGIRLKPDDEIVKLPCWEDSFGSPQNADDVRMRIAQLEFLRDEVIKKDAVNPDLQAHHVEKVQTIKELFTPGVMEWN